jgi:hypothetical protein
LGNLGSGEVAITQDDPEGGSGSGYRSGLTYQEKERKMNDDLLKELWNKGAAYMAQEYT